MIECKECDNTGLVCHTGPGTPYIIECGECLNCPACQGVGSSQVYSAAADEHYDHDCRECEGTGTTE